ncbi:MAG: hypothetical protein EOP89_04770 [Lysobacteraceae bacterium]|nr:MAG: hypothetical protein EOP89_04770 [Xanthomonadaceae bacterium]
MRWIVLTSLALSLPIAAPAMAQSDRSARNTQTTYGARVGAIGRNNVAAASAAVNQRLDTRINSRIANRIDRYRTGDANPAAAVSLAQNQLIKQTTVVQQLSQPGYNP